MRPGQAARSASLFFDLPGLGEEREDFAGQPFRGEFRLWNHAPRARAGHFLRVAQLVAVCGAPEGNEDGGAARCGYFCCGNGSCSANDDIRPGKALRHVREKGHYLRVDLAPRVRGAHRIIVTFASLMHDAQFTLAHRQAVHGVHEGAVDG